jgi:hypothetical protein
MKGTRTSLEGDREESTLRVLAGGSLSAVLWGPGPGVNCKWLESQQVRMSEASPRTLELIDGQKES